MINYLFGRLKLSLVLTINCNRTLSHNAETKDFARPTSHPVRGWTGKNKAFCSPGTQNGRRVIKVYNDNNQLNLNDVFIVFFSLIEIKGISTLYKNSNHVII